MADKELLAVNTPVTAGALYSVLRLAWLALLGTEPSRASLLTLLSQWSLETGGGRACIAFNLAGIKYTPGCGTDFASYPTQEVIGGKFVTLHPPDPGCRFRAYDSLEHAAGDYLAILHKRFWTAWPAVEAGDPRSFAHLLKAAHYYTAPEDQYAAGLAARFAALDAQVPGADTVAPAQAELFKPAVVLPDPVHDAPEEPS